MTLAHFCDLAIPEKVPRRHHQTAEARMSKRKNPFGLRSETAESVEVGLKSSPGKTDSFSELPFFSQ